ncbi:MAG: hypothetical protein QXK49_03660 [Candidatus Aenigmatarchaeota archaeon]
MEKNIIVNPETAIFRCKVPIYTINGKGELVKLIWNCEKQTYEEVKEKYENEQRAY